MEELFKKYNVKIREFEVEVGKSKVICRDVIPKDELLTRLSSYEIVLYLYPNFFRINNLTIFSNQDFLIENLEKILSLSSLLKKRNVSFYGKNLDLLDFIIRHTPVSNLNIVEKGSWVKVNSLVYNLSCGESLFLSLLSYLHEIYKPLIVGNCSLASYAPYFINRGIVSILQDRVYIDGNIISPPDQNLLSFFSMKFLKNRYVIRNPKVDVTEKIKELEEKYSFKKIVIEEEKVNVIDKDF